eukprot:jgi/Pico_ML_1/56013/g1614.t1
MAAMACLTPWKRTSKPIKQRHVVVALCALSTFVCYADRINMSVTILHMAAAYEWSSVTQGWILSSFFYGYILTQVVGGLLAQKYGGKQVLNFAVMWWSVFTYITPFASRQSISVLLLARFLMGLGEGMAFPCVYHVLSRFVPPEERSRSFAVVQGGVMMGTVFSFLTAPLLCGYFGWESVFYSYAILGFVWSFFWMWIAPDDFGMVPYGDRDDSMHFEECEKMLPHVPGTSSHAVDGKATAGSFSCCRLLRHPAVLAILVVHFCHNWGLYIMLSWFPTYCFEVLGIDKTGVYITFFPYLMMAFAAIFGGWAADRLLQSGKPILTVRKLMTFLGLMGPAVFLPLFSLVQTKAMAMFLASLALSLATSVGSGALINHVDIAPQHSGTLLGITNTAASLPGIISVPLTAYLLQITGGLWVSVFLLSSTIQLSGLWFYWKHARADRIFP